MMSSENSAVLEFGAPEPGETASLMEDKLRFHTDAWDLSVDLKAGLVESSSSMFARTMPTPPATFPARSASRTGK